MNFKIVTSLLALCTCLNCPVQASGSDLDLRNLKAPPELSSDEIEDMRAKLNNGVEPEDFDIPAVFVEAPSPEQTAVTTPAQWKALNEKATAGDAESLYIIGLCFAKGHKVPQDLPRAYKFFFAAAGKGHNQAQLLCARCLEQKIGISSAEDEKAALIVIPQYYGFPALKGDVAANYHYGRYMKYAAAKKGDPKSYAQHFRFAAEKGHTAALYELALCYRDGEGVSKLRKLSHKLLRACAERGYGKAQYELGLCHAAGNYRVPKNLIEGYAWLAAAISNGVPDDAWALANVKNQLSSADLEAARSLALEYSSKFKTPPPSAKPLL